jgi:nucleotide-binding universal stress UspA family protein
MATDGLIEMNSCIFVGSRGLGQVKRFLLGSVSAAAAVRAHCSVEVVRTAAEK